MSSDYDERAQRFWSIYVDEAEQHDTNITETWKSDMDSTLIFAGLFSATVTAFIIESYKLLQDDSEAAVKDILKQILAIQMVGASLNTSIISIPTNVPPTPVFHPPAWAIAVNILWFLSLTCSLAAALCVTLVQQWIRDYLQRIQRTSQPQRRATIRGIMFSGSEKWKMNDVVEYIPILLHLSLFLFFVGLCTFLSSVNMATTWTVLAILVCCLAFYGLATVAPLIDPSAPYETPFSSLLWLAIHRHAAPMIPLGAKSLSEVRELLASPFDRQSLQRRIHAVSWVYDRTIDDRELQEFVTSIPGLLSSQDGQIAWKDFLDKSPGAIRELEGRIVRLLKGCSAAGYLDKKSRQLRATLCIDALLAISSSPDFLKTSSTVTMELDDIIQGLWDDDGMLATKSVCAEAVFGRRALFFEIPKMKSSLETGFLYLSNEADRALKDIDDLREILEDVLREPPGSGLPIQKYKTDISNLLRVYFAVVEAKTSILHRWITDIQHILPEGQHFPLLSWYYSIPPTGLRIIYESILAPSEKTELKLHAFQMLAYLRLQGVYPAYSEISGAPRSNTQGLSRTWFPLTEEIPLRRVFNVGTRIFKPFGPTRKLTGNASFTNTTHNVRPIDPGSSIYEGICRELQPISALLDILDTSPATTVTVHVKFPPQQPQQYLSRRLVPLTTQAEGPFRSLASILEAIVEDEGTVGGFVELTTTIKSHLSDKTVSEPFQPLIISQLLETICPPLLNSHSKSQISMSMGSQILFVGVLREILNWERDAISSFGHQAYFPFYSMDIQRLCDLLKALSHELPVEMAERALGTTLNSPGAAAIRSSLSVRDRAYRVYNYVVAHRSSASPSGDEWQQSPSRSPIAPSSPSKLVVNTRNLPTIRTHM